MIKKVWIVNNWQLKTNIKRFQKSIEWKNFTHTPPNKQGSNEMILSFT